METANEKNTAALLHLSALSQYFIPFGNFILPIVIWAIGKKDSAYVDHHGRQSINFHLSMLLYTLILCVIAIPIFIFTIFRNAPINAIIDEDNFVLNGHDFNVENFSGIVVIALTAVFLFVAMKTAEFFLVIYATIKAANGELYKYPLTINFIKEETINLKTEEQSESPEPSQA